MGDKIRIELGDVQRTLLMPLWGRAMEFEQPNPYIRDPLAHELIGRIDHDFDRMGRSFEQQFQVNWALRAKYIDDMLRRVMAEHPDATVVNIGAGLDTTFQRVDNGRIFWYDLDLPDTIDFRRKLIPESARNVYLAKSVLDPSWYADIKVRGSKVFFVAAGVLTYFRKAEVKRLFLDLIQEFPGSEIAFELMNKFLVWLSNRAVVHQKRTKKELVKMHWGGSSAAKIGKWSDRIRVVEEFPFYQDLEIRPEWTRRTVRDLMTVRRHRWVKMVHLEFV